MAALALPLGKLGVGEMKVLVLHTEVIVRTKLLVSKVKGSISGKLFREISMVKVWVPTKSP